MFRQTTYHNRNQILARQQTLRQKSDLRQARRQEMVRKAAVTCVAILMIAAFAAGFYTANNLPEIAPAGATLIGVAV